MLDGAESPITEPKTLDKIAIDETTEEFKPLPQSQINLSEADNETTRNEASIVVKSAEESKASKAASDVKIQGVSSEMGDNTTCSTETEHAQLDRSGVRINPAKADEANGTKSTDIQVHSENSSHNALSSSDDSLTRKVNKALDKNPMPPLTMSALDSIEVKSVSSTNSSKFAAESEKFQSSSLWQFVKKFIPEEQQHVIKNKMVSELSKSTDLSSMSSNNSRLNPAKTKPLPNQSGKSVLSEQRFVDGLVYSPMGSHKSSTPDHSFISGWKYTRDSEFINGNIKVAESESSDQKTPSLKSKNQSYQSSGLSHSADELSERVRKLLRQIDDSLEEKSQKSSPAVPRLRGLEDIAIEKETRHEISSQVTGTPRSIEDLTSDERYGSFMPKDSQNKSPESVPMLARPVIPEEEEDFGDDFESSLEEGEIRDSLEDGEIDGDTLSEDLKPRDTSHNQILTEQIDEEYQTSRLREELEMEQIELNLQLEGREQSQNTQSTSGLKSEDAIPPEFPAEAFGSRDTSAEKKNDRSSKMYFKEPKRKDVKTPQPTPDNTQIEIEVRPSSVNKSVRIIEAATAPPSQIGTVFKIEILNRFLRF